MGKFKTSLFYSNIFREDGQYCFGFGWASEVIKLQLSTLTDLVNCYKYIVTDLSKIGDTVLNNEAKWIDNCSPSGNTKKMYFKDWTVQEAIYDTNLNMPRLISLIGGTSLDSRGCWQFAWWTKWTPYVAQLGFKGIKHFVASTDSHHDTSFDEMFSKIESGEDNLTHLY